MSGYLAPRVCPNCGRDWSAVASRPDITVREATCQPCRVVSSKTLAARSLSRMINGLPIVQAPRGWALAACRDSDPELFFPEKGRTGGFIAKSICEDCPARRACLQFALDSGEEHGIWGGTTPNERKRLRRAEAANAS